MIREAETIEEVAAVVALTERVWGRPLLDVGIGRAVQRAGGYVVGAWEGDDLVGASFAFLGEVGGRRLLHSHGTCAAPGAIGRGTGLALKHHQRDWCRARGIELIEWTFDPLVARNGWFNLGKLGAVGVEYLVDFYGALDTDLEQGEESDRCLVHWETADPRPRPVDPVALREEGVPVVLDLGDDGRPVPGGDPGDRALARVHPDIEALRRRDPAAATAWRRAFRDTAGAAVSAGHHLVGASRDAWYLLDRASGA